AVDGGQVRRSRGGERHDRAVAEGRLTGVEGERGDERRAAQVRRVEGEKTRLARTDDRHVDDHRRSTGRDAADPARREVAWRAAREGATESRTRVGEAAGRDRVKLKRARGLSRRAEA